MLTYRDKTSTKKIHSVCWVLYPPGGHWTHESFQKANQLWVWLFHQYAHTFGHVLPHGGSLLAAKLKQSEVFDLIKSSNTWATRNACILLQGTVKQLNALGASGRRKWACTVRCKQGESQTGKDDSSVLISCGRAALRIMIKLSLRNWRKPFAFRLCGV